MKKYGSFRPTGFDPAGLGLSDRQDWLVLGVSRTRDGTEDHRRLEGRGLEARSVDPSVELLEALPAWPWMLHCDLETLTLVEIDDGEGGTWRLGRVEGPPRPDRPTERMWYVPPAIARAWRAAYAEHWGITLEIARARLREHRAGVVDSDDLHLDVYEQIAGLGVGEGT